ncbi:hypothetical protein [Flavobacterium sp. HSC-61S13]|uniref:hypothetical protein n=1 Tax=Flavobacterium sp. HSC-61S13 TaxID=2910963 RepID=UPI0020A1B79B|nr:hypothetical protein [Flavobacterium sp. HSC-61S13]MCP1996294.1 hypothetical protein [Flavobacterium sp. HSC-61S13]
MKKALLLFGIFSTLLAFQSCTSDSDELAPKKETLINLSVTDTIPPNPPTYSTQSNLENGDLGKDIDKKK